MKVKNHLLTAWPAAAVFVSISMVYGLFSYWMPYVLDDLLFQGLYLEHNGGESSFSLNALIDFSADVRACDNGRLSNILSPIATLMVPRWLFSILTGVGCASMFVMMCSLAGFGKQAVAKAMLVLWVCSLVLLPWRNSIMVNDYLLNYLYPSLACMGFVTVMGKEKDFVRPRVLFIVEAIALAVPSGWFHEGFSVPLCAGFAVYGLMRKGRLSVAWWSVMAIFVATSMLTALAPGLLLRVGRELNGYSAGEKIGLLCTTLGAVVIMACAGIPAIWSARFRNAWRDTLSDGRMVILATASIMSAIIVLLTHSDARAGWPACLFAMVVIASFIRNLLVECGCRIGRKVVTRWMMALYVIVSLLFANVLRWQYRLNEEHNLVLEMMEESNNGTVYYDLINPLDIRHQTLYLAMRYSWILPWNLYLLNQGETSTGRYKSVVPKALEEYDGTGARVIAGTGGIEEYNGVLLLPEVSDEIHQQYMEGHSEVTHYRIETTDGNVYENEMCEKIRFFDKKGNVRWHVIPLRERIEGKVARIDYVSGQ